MAMSGTPGAAGNPGPRPEAELKEDTAGIVRVLFSGGGGRETAARVTNLALATVDGCRHAGILLLERDTVTATGQSDAEASAVAALEGEVREGPSWDALGGQTTCYVEDLREDRRWPMFRPRALSLGVRSILALRLTAGEPVGVLTLLSPEAGGFTLEDRARAQLLAVLAGFAVEAGRAHEEDQRLQENLFRALATREIIGQAQGILIEREHITAEQAFDVLRRASQHLNLKLREVARSLVETGEDPDTGEPPTRG